MRTSTRVSASAEGAVAKSRLERSRRSGNACPWIAALVVAWANPPTPAPAAWPTYRHDARRSGVSTETVDLPLVQAWMHQPTQPPSPAWPELPAKRDVYRRVPLLGPTTSFDETFHVAVADGALCFGSSADDTVYCLDAASGALRWAFVTDGPVRLAPTIASGRVYAGSDDGWVYCLDIVDGRLLWKYRGGPEDRRLPGNGRMISLWPVRCGVVVDDGIAYFCAGLFPSQGNHLCAVEALDGKEIWKRRIEVPSQGYLSASTSRLFVPTGRTAPQVFHRDTGAPAHMLPGAGADRRAGGCFTVLDDTSVAYSAGETWGIQFGTPDGKETILFADGLRVVSDGTVSYILTRDGLCALDRAHWLEVSRLRTKAAKTGADLTRFVALGGGRRSYLKWEVAIAEPCELILAGKTIFVGELDRVSAYDTEGKMLWRGTVRGRACGLAASDGRLHVSTDKGVIHCFQSGTPLPSKPHRFDFVEAIPPASPYPDDADARACAEAAEAILRRAEGGVARGYCLVLGVREGRLAYEIARRTRLQVVCVEPDARRVAEARRRLAAAALYGTRVTVHQGALDRLPFQRHWANLIVSEDTLFTGEPPGAPAELWRVLRPSGGALVLATRARAAAKRLADWGRESIAGWKVEESGGTSVAWTTRGPLPGAGEWSHFYANPGNTACSGDMLPPGPVDLQWFGGPGPRRMPDRHDKNVAPLCSQGRLFVSADDWVIAVDAYNGVMLWEREVPGSVRLGAFKHCGNMAAADDRLYVASGGDCLTLDVRTGELCRRLAIPTDAELADNGAEGGEWGYVAVEGALLFGSVTRPGAAFRDQTFDTEVLIWRDFMPVVCSDALFAHDRGSGRRLWLYRPAHGAILNPTLALGGGRIYFVESRNPATRRAVNGRVRLQPLLAQGADLVALDVSTGKTFWRVPAGLQALEHIVFLSYARERLLVSGTRNAPVGAGRRIRYDLAAFAADTGKPLWRNTQTPTPDLPLEGPHGEQVQHPALVGDVIYGNGFACRLDTGEPIQGWKWRKSGHCGTLSTSARCAFSRYNNPWMFDLETGAHTVLTTAARPGCWINIIPAGGLILVPEASAGCTCGYAIQASLAFAPRAP